MHYLQYSLISSQFKNCLMKRINDDKIKHFLYIPTGAWKTSIRDLRIVYIEPRSLEQHSEMDKTPTWHSENIVDN